MRVDITLGRTEDEERRLAVDDIGTAEHFVDTAVGERDLGERLGREIARYRTLTGKKIGERIRVRHNDDLAAQFVVLAESGRHSGRASKVRESRNP